MKMRGLMSSIRKQYPFDLIEKKWQSLWEKAKVFRTFNPSEERPEGHPYTERHGPDLSIQPPKYYALDMFPYPSGSGLHVGHPEGYTATDILSRYKRARGFNVLHPMGWDAFGLPAEQFAIKTGTHPRIKTKENTDNFRRQLKQLGFSYDWDREINTTDPNYVKWTQWIFLQLYNSYFDEKENKAKPVSDLISMGWSREQIDEVRLAFVDEVPVNWSPDLGTVLANEEVEEWKEKGYTVERRPLRQWMLRITKYAQRLIDELEDLDWPDSIKLLQRNWIGRSEGAEVDFTINETTVTVYTTRPDTLHGATYMVLAPEHPLVSEITQPNQKEAVENYIKEASKKSDLDRTELAKDKSGVFTGGYATNPVNGEKIPVWIADYVLMTYGTGSIMAVPAHDERDNEFASKFGIPIIEVVRPPEGFEGTCFTGEGVAINSGFLDGLKTTEAKEKIIDWLEEKKVGKKCINFKLRDWLFSRQRYWGEPFPIIWEDGQHQALSENELPVLQPDLEDFKPTGSPEGPLMKAKEWLTYSEKAKRETNTMPQWAGSCWYYLRYIDSSNDKSFVGEEAEKFWSGAENSDNGSVDLYVGGTEHAVLHLLYARFWHKILFDLGHVSKPEPFQKLVNQGIILGEDGRKMSKTFGNVVNPDDIVSDYGADSLRLFEMFMGPLEMVKPWSTKGVEGVFRFLGRVWRLFIEEENEKNDQSHQKTTSVSLDSFKLNNSIVECEPEKAQLKTLHACIKKVTEDTESMRFNTAISAMMIFVNEAIGWEKKPISVLRDFTILLSPYASHLAEELYQKLNQNSESRHISMAYVPWPELDESLLIESNIEIPVQINGKIRDKMVVSKDASKEEIENQAKSLEKISSSLEGKKLLKTIVVPGRLVNIVAK